MDDNAHIESWFRTCKYAPGYPPGGFETLAAAREWVLRFVTWYNGSHRHSGIAYVTPEQRHNGTAEPLLVQRRAVYEAARQRHPLRWKRHPRPWQAPDHVWLNPPPATTLKAAA
ncbi:transposase [Spongiibacter sp. KMU-158]|uniref:Transposase n=1 Tax=Spongiibacter pelagi TaxID=2760804 RepID=A0A927C2T4_9GAMM|nr:transposase [Spongiibacter pelagi]